MANEQNLIPQAHALTVEEASKDSILNKRYHIPKTRI